MTDLMNCMAGKNKYNQWHVACATDAALPLTILMDMGYDNITSPDGLTYYRAAAWVCDHKGVSWTTNALGVPTTCGTLPKKPPF